jgi:hypothetical protein
MADRERPGPKPERVSLAPLEFADALDALLQTGPPPAEPVKVEKKARKKAKKRPAK